MLFSLSSTSYTYMYINYGHIYLCVYMYIHITRPVKWYTRRSKTLILCIKISFKIFSTKAEIN